MLIPNMWYAVLDSSEVKTRKPHAFKRLGEALVCWRDAQGQIVVMRDRCPHRSSQLSPGRLINGHIQCPFHGFEFDRDGACRLIPANGRNGAVPQVFQCVTYPAREAHGYIWIWNGEPRSEYPPLPWFDDLDGFAYSTFQVRWDVDHTRAIEGLLDVSHLPFVHARTIGRDQKTLVNGPYTTLENDRIRVWLSNQPDEGLPALKPSQLPPPSSTPNLLFNYPNVWQIRLGDRVRAVNVLAPVDDETTVVYTTTLIQLPRARALGPWVAAMFNVFNRYLLSEDHRVIRTQRPKVADLNVGERFIPADRPIALYLQHRRDLIAGGAEGRLGT